MPQPILRDLARPLASCGRLLAGTRLAQARLAVVSDVVPIQQATNEIPQSALQSKLHWERKVMALQNSMLQIKGGRLRNVIHQISCVFLLFLIPRAAIFFKFNALYQKIYTQNFHAQYNPIALNHDGRSDSTRRETWL